MNKDVSILIPHYKTLKMTQLCLALLKKNTNPDRVEAIIIDNGSNDQSSVYLKSIDWITLYSREKVLTENAAQSHSNALNFALEKVAPPYFLSIHTDTFVIDPGWLDFLLEKFKGDENLVGVGSWKLEFKPLYKRLLKSIEKIWQTRFWYPVFGKGEGKIAGMGENYYYLRSHCALYKTQEVRDHTNGFNEGETVGKVMHRKLVENGFSMRFLDPNLLSNILGT